MEIKHLVLAVFVLLVCSGCISGLLQDIPNNEFESLEYTRGGNVTSVRILAEGAQKTDDELVIKNLEIDESWPWFTAKIKIKGYRRELKEDADDLTPKAVEATTSD